MRLRAVRFTKNRIDKIDEDRKKASRARGNRAMFMPKGKLKLFAPKFQFSLFREEESVFHPEARSRTTMFHFEPVLVR